MQGFLPNNHVYLETALINGRPVFDSAVVRVDRYCNCIAGKLIMPKDSGSPGGGLLGSKSTTSPP